MFDKEINLEKLVWLTEIASAANEMENSNCELPKIVFSVCSVSLALNKNIYIILNIILRTLSTHYNLNPYLDPREMIDKFS